MHWTSGDIQAAAAGGTAATLISLWAWRKWRKVVRFATEFRDDWKGVPPRPGVPGRPGLMERVANIEGQLKPNDGHSMHDAVSGTARAVNRIEQQLATPQPPPAIHIHPAAGKEQE